MLNKSAIFSDGTIQYRIPWEPDINDVVKILIRTGKNNVENVNLITGKETIDMKKAFSDSLFDYYEGSISLSSDKVSYFFEIKADNTSYYYNQEGVVSEIHSNYNFVITPGFFTPDWAKGAVFYQIFVDRFYNGDRTNDVEDREYIYNGEGTKKVVDWSKYPAVDGVREFYGGDLLGVIKKLDYLKDLGIEVIYLNPVFVSPSNHKYDIQDYDYIDPHFGVILEDGGDVLPDGVNTNLQATKYRKRVTDEKNLEASNQLFIHLVEEIHKRGMKVILDGVFNHCGSFNKWLDREGIYQLSDAYASGAYSNNNSPYHNFFHFLDSEGTNIHYEGWWNYDTLPKLNYEGSSELYNYIMNVGKKWVAPPFNCDGWRLDVAADLAHSYEFNHKFWKDFRKSVKKANPNALILAEHYGDPSSWMEGDEWDSVMNYDAFMEPVTWFLTGMEKHSDEFRSGLIGKSDAFFDSMKHYMSRFPVNSLLVAMNELSNHDHSRFLTRTNGTVGRIGNLGPLAAEANINKGIMKAAVTIQMTWPGAPTIYYGDEAGLCGWTDPDNRRTYPWGKEDWDLIQFHKEMIRLHTSYETLKLGSIYFLSGLQGVLSYGRFDRENQFIIAVNINTQEVSIDINGWELGITDEDTLVRLMLTTEREHSPAAEIYRTKSGILRLTLPPVSSMVIKNMVR
jgi:alpha-glucosidase